MTNCATHRVPTDAELSKAAENWHHSVNECDRRVPTREELIDRAKAILAEGQQIQDDADHWNRMNPDQEPIVLDLSYLEKTREVLRRLEER